MPNHRHLYITCWKLRHLLLLSKIYSIDEAYTFYEEFRSSGENYPTD